MAREGGVPGFVSRSTGPRVCGFDFKNGEGFAHAMQEVTPCGVQKWGVQACGSRQEVLRLQHSIQQRGEGLRPRA
eukprot:82471-Chlamydomonas_euryale.AAC.2